MEDLMIPAGASTPAVTFCAETARLRIEGESYPENSLRFYQPLIAWVGQRLALDERPLTLEICLSYLNTSSIKCIMDILDDLEEAHQRGRPVSVNWFYDEENDRALEMAEEFREELTLPFGVVPFSEKRETP